MMTPERTQHLRCGEKHTAEVFLFPFQLMLHRAPPRTRLSAAGARHKRGAQNNTTSEGVLHIMREESYKSMETSECEKRRAIGDA